LWELIRRMTRLTQKQFNMEYTVIKNEKQYNKAINRLEQIFDAKKSTREGDELELLSLLIDKYEQEKYPIDFPDPIDAIKFRMEQLGYQQKDLVSAIGLKSRVSEILNRKRKLTLEMIRKLSTELSIPTDILVKEY
jgi:HTH-type transcriptional regulator / antitoxin HigA